MNHLYSIVSVLADGHIHSGPALAREIGISRTAVWKAVKTIQSGGLEICAIKGKGYHLPGPRDALNESAIRQLIGDTNAGVPEQLEIHTVLDSTNDYLLKRIPRGTIDHHVVLAHCQTAGRGRRGKQWLSPLGGGLYISLGVHFHRMIMSPRQLSLLVGVTVIQALADQVPAKIQLKWPNDIVFDFHKLGGVLLDVRGEGDGPRDVIIGIGINIKLPEAIKDDIDQPWTDIASITGKVPNKNQLAAGIIKRIYRILPDYSVEDQASLVKEWQKYDAFLGKNAMLCWPGRSISGIVRGVDHSGDLLFCVNGKIKPYGSGELSLRAPP